MARKVCEKLGWDVEFSPIDWSAKDALLEQGQINCIWNGFTIEGREGKYAFTEPYMVNRQVILVKSGSGITDTGELKGKKVITQADSTAYDALTGEQKSLADTFGSLDTIADYNNAFMQLESGAVDAVACDLSIANYQMANNSGKFVQLADPISADENYGVGFKNDDTGKELAKQVTQAMKDLDKEGYAKELCEKYASYGMSYDNWKLK
jgi:polar amino acid transport system substrate-binding protein